MHFREAVLSNFPPTVLSVSAEQPCGFPFAVNCLIAFEMVHLVYWMPGQKSDSYHTAFAKTKCLAASDSEPWKTAIGFKIGSSWANHFRYSLWCHTIKNLYPPRPPPLLLSLFVVFAYERQTWHTTASRQKHKVTQLKGPCGSSLECCFVLCFVTSSKCSWIAEFSFTGLVNN